MIPYINDSGLKNIMWVFTAFGFTLSHQLAPYTLLMYGITYSGVFRSFQRFLKWSPYIFFLPVLYMYLTCPIIPEYYPPFLILSLWVVPYILTANSLLVYSYFKEQNPRIKQQRLLSCIVVTPATLFTMMSNYVLRIFDYNVWQYNVFTIAAAFIIFVVASVRYGVMGVRLKLEKSCLDSAMKAMSSGTAILNHSIKNEVFKISLCMKNIMTALYKPEKDIEEIEESIKIVMDSTEHLKEMIVRIQKQVNEIEVFQEENDLSSIVDRSVGMVRPYLERKNITVDKKFESETEVFCDSVHITEALNNIFKNSIEAMDTGGRLDISVQRSKREITVSISDNGKGISKENMPYVFDPFFTTKQRTMNYGLGLSYCFNVLKKHRGRLELQSEENKGTTVQLVFPRKKMTGKMFTRGHEYG